MVSRCGGRKEPTMHCFVTHCGHPQPQHHGQHAPAPSAPSLNQFRIIPATNTGRPDVTFHVAATAFPPQQGGGAAPPGGPQLRSLHHPHHGASPSLPPSHQQQPPPPNQPQHSSGQPGPVPTSTPPGPAEMGKQGPHIQGQPQGIPQGGQMQLSFSVPNQSRPNQSQPYFAGPRGPAPRMPNHRGPVVNMPASNVGQQIYSPTVPLPPMQMYPVAPLNAGGQMFVPGQVQVFSTGSRHQGAGTNFFQPPAGSQQLLMHQHQLPFQGFQPNQGPYFYSSMRGAGMTGAPGGVGPGMTGGANQQVVVPGTAPQMGQTGQVSMMALPGNNVMGVSGLAGDSGTPSGPVSSSNSTGNKQIRRKHALDIVDPITMKNVDIYDSSGGSTPQRSGDSSARETPQPNPGPGQMDVAAEFAARVAKAASEKSSGPPPSQDVFTEPSSASVHQVTNVNGPEPISMSSIPTSDSVLSQTDNLSKPSGAGLEDCISSSWKQTQPKVASIGNKINSNTKHVKIEACASKIEDQGTLNLEANNVLKQEIDRERVPPGVPSVSIKDVPVSQPELPVTTSLVQQVIPTVVAPLKEHSLSVLPDPSLTPVVSAITNSPDIELVHHRSSNREQYPGLKSSSPAHLSPRRKPRVPENPSFGKVLSSQSLPAVSTVGNISSAITQVSSTVGTTVLTSGDIKIQREPSSIPVSVGEQRLVQSKKVPVSESTSNQCVDASGFVAPVPKEQHREEKKPRSRDRSSQGKDVADKVHEKSQGRDRDKMTARNKENTTPQSSSSSASQSPATLGEPSLVSRMVAKPLPVVSSLEEISNKQANGETGDITEGKATQHRSKHKRQQKKELNRKGAEKEGTEMDAFAEASSPASRATSENTVPSRSHVVTSSTPVSAALPPQSHSPTPSNSIAASIPIPDPSHSTSVSSVVSQVTAQSTTVSALSPPAISSESVSNPSSDPVSQLPASTNSMLLDNTKSDSGEEKTHHDHKNEIQLEKEDQEKIVVARNEENTKMSPINTEKQPLIEDSASVKSNHLPKSEEDQCSPNNLDGKKKYEREFLMSLKNEPLSKKKPNLLPEHEIVLKESRPSRSLDIARGCHDTFTPKFMSSLGPSRGGVPPKRSSQQGKAKSGKSGVIHVTLSLREEVKLRETENAWKPVRLKPNEAQELDAKTEELYKKVRGVLNKLTPQKFTTLVDQVRNLPIDTLEKLQGVINLIFDKAIDEPSFSVAYALMCKVLSDMNVSSNKDQKKPKEDEMTFRKLIVIRCQQEFEKSNVAELNKEQRLKEIASVKDPEKKREMQLLFEEECRKLRMKSVGNIRFIGELFKLQILTVKIMIRCIWQLLNDGEEESLECLCKLLTTIGHEFEMVKQESLEPYFSKMKEICKKKGEISSRVRFMLQDVIELRQNKWVPRRDDLNPKTIDQINKEAEKEAAEQAMNSGPSSGPRFKNEDRGGDRKKSRGPSEDGWSVAAGRAKNYPVDTAKLRTKVLESDTISLGNRNTYVWCSHSKAADPNKKNASKVISNNSFAALQDMSNEEKHVSGFSSRSAVNKIAPSSSVEKERMLAGLKSVTEDMRPQRSHIQQSRSSSRDNAPCNSDELHINASQRPMLSSGNDESFRGKSPDASSLPSVVPLISDEEAKIRAVGLLGEFLNNFSETLAMQEIVAVFGGMKLNILVWEFLNGVLEKSSTARKKVGQFFCTLMAEGIVPRNIFLSSFSTLIDDGDDLSIDVPLIWLYLAEIIVPSLSSERITFSDIRVVAKNQGKLVAELLKLLVEDKGPAWVKSHWDSAGCTWTDFVRAENVKDFVKQRNLDFTLSAGLVSQTSGSLLPMDEVQKKLVQFFKPEPGFAYSFDDICDWISANVGDRVSDPQFVRALMTALCESATSRSGTSAKLKDEVLIQHCKFFQKYVNGKEEYEMQCLYAVQAFVNELEHPQGLICKIFQILWENNFISTDSFMTWQNSKEPSEQAGKGVAVVSLTSFFTCLGEVEEESEES